MSTWNPTDPEHWTQAFGLVAVPYFGRFRDGVLAGEHRMMQDGPAASFALHIAPKDEHTLATSRLPLGWAWSSHVRHAVVLDATSRTAVVRRWDAPDKVERRVLASEREAGRFIRELERDRVSHLPGDVIEKTLRSFSLLRDAIEQRGGVDLDVVLAFNAALLMAEEYRRIPLSVGAARLAETVSRLAVEGRPGFVSRQISPVVANYPLGEFVEMLLADTGGDSPYLLDADLLIRHASGVLYQEAHRRLATAFPQSYQQSLFGDALPSRRGGAREPAPRSVHHTPPWLARALAQFALAHTERPTGRPLDILDPACGSGVFLIEAARELDRGRAAGVRLRGFDVSKVAGAMTEFCLGEASRDMLNAEVSPEVRSGVDSLASIDWGEPDIILMNPPFQAWNDLDEHTRTQVKSALGGRASHRPDLCLAFIARAAASLRPGGVLATIVPAVLFQAKSAGRLREQFTSTKTKLRVRLIGLLKGFDTFSDATVEAAILVIAKSGVDAPVRTLIASSGAAERAVRLLRVKTEVRMKGVEIGSRPSESLSKEGWVLHGRRDMRFAETLSTLVRTRVRDLFAVRLGVRGIGAKKHHKILLVSQTDFSRLAPTRREQAYFRPIADNIQDGRVQQDGYLFYPYDTDGKLLLTSEVEVANAVPSFFSEVLLPAKQLLADRRSLNRRPGGTPSRRWWEPSEPVASWLAPRTPRIVSQEFGKEGNFAFDREGMYAVVGGHGWCWLGGGDVSGDVMFGYLAILNSQVFARLLKVFCPKLQGGQYRLESRYVYAIPLPDLSAGNAALAAIGRQIHAGVLPAVNFLDEAVLAAYGYLDVGSAKTPTAIPSRSANQFIKRLYKLGRSNEHKAADAIYEYMNDHLVLNQFDACDNVLAAIDVTAIPLSSVIALLVATRRAKGELPSRENMYTNAIKLVADVRGREAADRLLGKYY